MTNINPSFDQPIVGQHKEKSSIYSVLFGTNATLLENELNEMQWLSIERNANIIKELYGSGFITNVNLEHNIDTIKLTNINNNTIPFSLLINGYLLNICGSTNEGEINRDTSSPENLGGTINGKKLVFLEVWFDIVGNSNNKIKKFGGETTEIDYTIQDLVRVGKETSRRIQLRWKIRVIDKENDILNVKVQGKNYQKQNNDNFYYVDTGTSKKINEIKYALPICVLNSNAPLLTNNIPYINLKNKKIIDSTDNLYYNLLSEKDGATKTYVDTEISNKITNIGSNVNAAKLEGNGASYYLSRQNHTGSHTTDLDLGNNNILNLKDPTSDQHAATKKYVDGKDILAGNGLIKTTNTLNVDLSQNSGLELITSGTTDQMGLKINLTNTSDSTFESGLTLTTSGIEMKLASNSGLEITNTANTGGLKIDLASNSGLEITSTGTDAEKGLKIDLDTNSGLTLSNNGLKVDTTSIATKQDTDSLEGLIWMGGM